MASSFSRDCPSVVTVHPTPHVIHEVVENVILPLGRKKCVVRGEEPPPSGFGEVSHPEFIHSTLCRFIHSFT